MCTCSLHKGQKEQTSRYLPDKVAIYLARRFNLTDRGRNPWVTHVRCDSFEVLPLWKRFLAGAHFSFRLKKRNTEFAACKAGLCQSLLNALILTCLALESDSSNRFREIKVKSGLTSTLPPAFGCLARLTPIHSSSLSSLQVFPQIMPRELPTGQEGRQQGKET